MNAGDMAGLRRAAPPRDPGEPVVLASVRPGADIACASAVAIVALPYFLPDSPAAAVAGRDAGLPTAGAGLETRACALHAAAL